MQHHRIQITGKTLSAAVHLFHDRPVMAGKVKLSQGLVDTREACAQHGLHPVEIPGILILPVFGYRIRPRVRKQFIRESEQI